MLICEPDAGKTVLCVPVAANGGTEYGQTLLGHGCELRLLPRAYQPFVEPSHGCLTRSNADALQQSLSGWPRSCRSRHG